MKPNFAVTLIFLDDNQPRMVASEDTRDAAMATARHMLAQFAGVKCLWLDDHTEKPMRRHVANAFGAHLFSVQIPRNAAEINLNQQEVTP